MRKFVRILYSIFLTVDHLSRAHSSSKRSSLIIQEKWDRVEVYTAAAKKICLWPERPWYVRYHIWEKSVWVFEPLVYVFICILEEMLPISYFKNIFLYFFYQTYKLEPVLWYFKGILLQEIKEILQRRIDE